MMFGDIQHMALDDLMPGDVVKLVSGHGSTDKQPVENIIENIETLEHNRRIVTVRYLDHAAFGGVSSPVHEMWNTVRVWLWKFSRIEVVRLIEREQSEKILSTQEETAL